MLKLTTISDTLCSNNRQHKKSKCARHHRNKRKYYFIRHSVESYFMHLCPLLGLQYNKLKCTRIKSLSVTIQNYDCILR